jgi:hypothetical protein
VARPLDLPPEEVAKRPDVLVIESGEIELPTQVKGMKSIGLPNNVIYACLAETIVLALEGRFEVFTIGRDTEWEKVKEIYRLGIKHGMKLSAISGAKGVYSDADIANVVKLAKKALPRWQGGSTTDKPKRLAAPQLGKASRARAVGRFLPALSAARHARDQAQRTLCLHPVAKEFVEDRFKFAGWHGEDSARKFAGFNYQASVVQPRTAQRGGAPVDGDHGPLGGRRV